MLLFSSFIVFSGFDESEYDILMSTKSVVDVAMHGPILSVTFNSDAEGEEVKPVLSPLKKRGTWSRSVKIMPKQVFERCCSNAKENPSDLGARSSKLRSMLSYAAAKFCPWKAKANNRLSDEVLSRSCSSGLQNLVKNQGVVTFCFRPSSNEAGMLMKDAAYRRMASLSKSLTMGGLLKLSSVNVRQSPLPLHESFCLSFTRPS